jgi:hypothetical protein
LRSREDVGFSADTDQRRRIIDHLQAQGIAGLSQRKILNVLRTCGVQFRRCLFASKDA